MRELCPNCRQPMPKSSEEMKEDHLQSIMRAHECDRECAEFLDSFGDWSQQGSHNMQRREMTLIAFQERKRSWDKIKAMRVEK